MLIQICDEKKGKRPIIVSDGDKVLFEGEADNVAEAHKLLKALRKHDWDAGALAAATKAAGKKEADRVEEGKRAAEPKK